MTHRTARAARFLLGGLLVAILVSLSGCYGYGRYAVYDDQYGYFPYDYYPYGFYPYGISRTDHHFHGDRDHDHDHHGGWTRHDWNGRGPGDNGSKSRASTGGSRSGGTRGSGLAVGRSGGNSLPSSGSHGGLGNWGGSGSGRSSGGGGRF